MDNIQHIIGKIRSPRVQITYDVETNGAKVLKQLPYIIGILSDLRGDSKKNIPYNERKFIQISGSNINTLMEYWEVMVKAIVPKWQGKDNESIELEIPLNNIHDFHPDNLIDNLFLLKNLKDQLTTIKELKRKVLTSNIFAQSLLTEINNGKLLSQIEKSQSHQDEESSKKTKK
jgi:type VI secretion system protein ImpB